MSIRLKIICILFGAAYFYIIGEQMVTENIADFMNGFNEGFMNGYNEGLDSTKRSLDKQETGNRETAVENYEIYFFHAKPKNGLSSFPTSFKNNKNSSLILTNVDSFRAKILNPVKLSNGLLAARGFRDFFSFVVLFLLIYIPIQVYKTIRSVVKNEIFEMKTIHRIRRIGYALLLIFGFLVYHSFVDYAISKALISMEDYKIVFSIQEEYIFLLFGLVTLLFAEILKISHTIKEENDLTV
ncbi:hypothetical protein FACS189432_04910 [Bacteroidia bacterium]|nr:hypothetical protein FACS189432_04910 [Bacteroidia bacterium]GHT85093.1 hypothetical protein FACS18947_3430 [Bacteroidia bacterium]